MEIEMKNKHLQNCAAGKHCWHECMEVYCQCCWCGEFGLEEMSQGSLIIHQILRGAFPEAPENFAWETSSKYEIAKRKTLLRRIFVSNLDWV